MQVPKPQAVADQGRQHNHCDHQTFSEADGAEKDDQRKKDIELLLHTEGPELSEQRIILPGRHRPGIVERIRRQPCNELPVIGREVEKDKQNAQGRQVSEIEGEDSKGAPGPELTELIPQRSHGLFFLPEDPGDEESAEDEEQLNPDPTIITKARMEYDHQ